MDLVAIDPGYAVRGKGCAIAMFVNSRLVATQFLRQGKRFLAEDVPLDHVDEVIWECPQVDSRTVTSTPACVQLAAVGGTIAGLIAGAFGAQVFAVSPSDWKGSVPKPVHHKRLWDKLYPDEIELLGGAETLRQINDAVLKGAGERWKRSGGDYYPRSWLTHNLLDAVGIGLWRVPRRGI